MTDLTTKQSDFSVLLQTHTGIIWSVCHKYRQNECDKEDLFQDIALSAWKTFHLFEWKCKFSTWLYRISIRTAVGDYRTVKEEIKAIALDNCFYEISSDYEAHTRIGNKIDYSIYLSQLSNSELQFVLLYAEGVSYSEMQNILGVNENNLRVRMGRIKQRLNKYT